MPSLTPDHRAEEVTEQAMSEGLVNGGLVLVPSLATLYGAMQNPKFVKVTNWQSRTALAIMPAFFAFCLTSEQKMIHRMHEVAEETEHTIKSVEWADQQHRAEKQKKLLGGDDEQKRLREMYRNAVLSSGVQVVETDELQPFHKVANFVQQNPFKCIAGIGIPAVAYIFHGQRNSMNFQLQLLHTRVFGQFAVICSLLGVMGLKEQMDQRGRYITEAEVNQRVIEMEKTRIDLLQRLDYQSKQSKQYTLKR